jgi:hypothetical protein
MKISKNKLKILRDMLPKGSILIIRNNLSKKGHGYSQSYVSKCLDPNNDRYNEMIVNEALLLIEDLKVRSQKIDQRIAVLNEME